MFILVGTEFNALFPLTHHVLIFGPTCTELVWTAQSDKKTIQAKLLKVVLLGAVEMLGQVPSQHSAQHACVTKLRSFESSASVGFATGPCCWLW